MVGSSNRFLRHGHGSICEGKGLWEFEVQRIKVTEAFLVVRWGHVSRRAGRMIEWKKNEWTRHGNTCLCFNKLYIFIQFHEDQMQIEGWTMWSNMVKLELQQFLAACCCWNYLTHVDLVVPFQVASTARCYLDLELQVEASVSRFSFLARLILWFWGPNVGARSPYYSRIFCNQETSREWTLDALLSVFTITYWCLRPLETTFFRFEHLDMPEKTPRNAKR